MKKSKEFMLHVFIIASDKSEAEQVANRYGNKRFHQLYEFMHVRKCEGLTWCIVYRVKKLPSIKDLKKALSEPDEQRINNIGTGFE
jgi:hypothetical protein